MGDEQMMRIGRRCFVGNLAWSTSWQDLKDVFKAAGNVVFTNVMREGNGTGACGGHVGPMTCEAIPNKRRCLTTEHTAPNKTEQPGGQKAGALSSLRRLNRL